ncbi:MAG: S-adenosyl-l-methionine hydroxide adenosyltransferase family protein [Pseudomonadales bacterium]
MFRKTPRYSAFNRWACGIFALLCAQFVLLESGFAKSSDRAKQPAALILQADFSGVVMTGVAHSVDPRLRIVNVRPLIPLYDIAAASESLAYNAQTWPAGTVFVSVVDPGVGTARKSVVLRTNNDLYFVSPDNGSLSGPARKYGVKAVREIDESVNRIPGSDWAHTFHGRDVYSYTGARLAAGVISFRQVGPRLEAKVMQLPVAKATYSEGVLRGHIAGGIDRLGNAYFSINRELFEQSAPVLGERFAVAVTHQGKLAWSGTLPYVKSFGGVPVGAELLFVDSSGNLAMAINQGNFASTHGLGKGPDWQVTVTRTQP